MRRCRCTCFPLSLAKRMPAPWSDANIPGRMSTGCLSGSWDLYRAESRRSHSGRCTWWGGKWRPDPNRAIAQAKRWQMKEPFAEVYVVCSNGMKAPLEELEQARASCVDQRLVSLKPRV